MRTAIQTAQDALPQLRRSSQMRKKGRADLAAMGICSRGRTEQKA